MCTLLPNLFPTHLPFLLKLLAADSWFAIMSFISVCMANGRINFSNPTTSVGADENEKLDVGGGRNGRDEEEGGWTELSLNEIHPSVI